MIIPTQEANHYRYEMEGEAPEKIQSYLQRQGFSTRLMSSIKRSGRLLLDGRPVRFVDEVSPGGVIDVYLARERIDVEPEEGELEVIYEDDEVLVVNKPALTVTHPTKDYQEGTLSHLVAGHFKRTGQEAKVRFVNRLDRDTTGVVVVAKNKFVHHYIQSRMGGEEVVKTYAAIVEGKPPESEGVIDLPIYRPDPESIERVVDERGQPSATEYSVKEDLGEASLLECVLRTGRTHQIRVHMKAVGHPIVGDPLYNPDSQEKFGFSRQALHAKRLELPLPKTGRHVFEAPLPEDMSRLREELRSGLD